VEDKIYYTIINDILKATRVDGSNPQALRVLANVVEETQKRLDAAVSAKPAAPSNPEPEAAPAA